MFLLIMKNMTNNIMYIYTHILVNELVDDIYYLLEKRIQHLLSYQEYLIFYPKVYQHQSRRIMPENSQIKDKLDTKHIIYRQNRNFMQIKNIGMPIYLTTSFQRALDTMRLLPPVFFSLLFKRIYSPQKYFVTEYPAFRKFLKQLDSFISLEESM